MGSHAFQRTPPEEANQVLDALRRIVRFLRMPASSSRASGLSAAQFFVLAQLKDSPAPSIRALAQRTMSDPSSVSVVAWKLVEQGLISRALDDTDGRRAGLAITARGKRVLARAPVLPQVRIVRALSGMPKRRRRVIAQALSDLVLAVGAHEIEPRMFFEDEPKPRKTKRRAKP